MKFIPHNFNRHYQTSDYGHIFNMSLSLYFVDKNGHTDQMRWAVRSAAPRTPAEMKLLKQHMFRSLIQSIRFRYSLRGRIYYATIYPLKRLYRAVKWRIINVVSPAER